jgi:hypothetical protein
MAQAAGLNDLDADFVGGTNFAAEDAQADLLLISPEVL